MKMLVWNDAFSVGLKAFDIDHRVMILTINALYRLLAEQQREKALLTAEELLHFTQSHIEREGEFLRQIGYPEFERIRHGQTGCIKFLHDFCAAIKEGRPNILLMTEQLMDGMIDYLVDADLRFKSFVEYFGHANSAALSVAARF